MSYCTQAASARAGTYGNRICRAITEALHAQARRVYIIQSAHLRPQQVHVAFACSIHTPSRHPGEAEVSAMRRHNNADRLFCSTGHWYLGSRTAYTVGFVKIRACASAAPMNTTSAPNEPEPNQSQVAPRESGASSITPALANPESHHTGVSHRSVTRKSGPAEDAFCLIVRLLEGSICQRNFAKYALLLAATQAQPLAWPRLLSFPIPAPRSHNQPPAAEGPSRAPRQVGLAKAALLARASTTQPHPDSWRTLPQASGDPIPHLHAART